MSLPWIHHTSRVLFETPLVLFGFWRCPPDSELWNRENQIGDRPVLALPWTSVMIRHAGADATLVNANDVVYYGAKEPYQRGLCSDRGDLCTFISPSAQLVRQVAERTGVDHHLESGRALFPFRIGPASSAVTVLQHRLARVLMQDMFHDPLEIEELLVMAVHRLVGLAAEDRRRRRNTTRRKTTDRVHRDTVSDVREMIARRSGENIGLAELAGAAHASPYHLCRIFKSVTGDTVSAYSRRLRLREAAERIVHSDASVTSIALGAGFGSHAHFTAAWSKEFGFPPTALRRDPLILGCIRSML
ncbi:MAG TPA: AraC family transcriptional regulator [Phycisphaerales bacterium]|nr:AraC family transcriptional regulator [Phycisphaerales bacterium]